MSLFTRALLAGSNKSILQGFSNGSIRNFTALHHRMIPQASTAIFSSSQPRPLTLVPSRLSSNHVPLWSAEKALSAALLPIIPAAFLCPSTTMDYLLAFAITLHAHWGIEAVVVDYVRPSIFGEVIPKVAVAIVFAFSAFMLGGLCYFTYTDVGLVKAVKMLWKL